jgi:hypothetical protein
LLPPALPCFLCLRGLLNLLCSLRTGFWCRSPVAPPCMPANGSISPRPRAILCRSRGNKLWLRCIICARQRALRAVGLCFCPLHHLVFDQHLGQVGPPAQPCAAAHCTRGTRRAAPLFQLPPAPHIAAADRLARRTSTQCPRARRVRTLLNVTVCKLKRERLHRNSERVNVDSARASHRHLPSCPPASVRRAAPPATLKSSAVSGRTPSEAQAVAVLIEDNAASSPDPKA